MPPEHQGWTLLSLPVIICSSKSLSKVVDEITEIHFFVSCSRVATENKLFQSLN